MRKKGLRLFNGILATVLVVFFSVHALLGSVSSFADIGHSLAWLVWVGVAIAAVHVIVSVFTSKDQLNDKVDPPSTRKKLHLVLKWVTGVALVAMVVVHVITVNVFGASVFQTMPEGAGFIMLVALALAAHVWVGAKSLVVDLGFDKRHARVARTVIVAVAIVVSLVALNMAILE